MDGESLARTLDLPQVVRFASIPSTMDAAHELARGGAPAGTLVLADAQTRGRGRGGSVWTSRPGAGVWMTLIERPIDASGLEVLSLRAGLRAARALDRFATTPVGIKWPNDLMLPSGKLAGILVEARWRGTRLEWVALGIGVNMGRDASDGVAVLELDGPLVVRGESGANRDAGRQDGEVTRRTLAVLGELVPALRAAAAGVGGLSPTELADYDRRDWARGRRVREPHRGTVVGISPDGALLIDTPDDGTIACTSGSLRVEERAP